MRKRYVIVISLITVVVLGSVALVAAARSKKRAQSAMCAGMLFPLTFVAREWAAEHDDCYPTNMLYLSNEVATRWLICPCDSSRRPASDWSTFTPEHSSYELVSAGIAQSDTNSVFLRCRIHGHMSYTDITVFDGTR